MENRALNKLRANAKNPRKISNKKLGMLRKAMLEFGDLGGIVQSGDGDLIGGHQRVDAFRNDPTAKVEIAKRYKQPTPAGTTAEGYVVIEGERFGYRETNWKGDKAKAAMLAANRSAGEWDITGLTALVNDLAATDFDLDLTMFDETERLAYMPDVHDLADEPSAPSSAEPEDGAAPVNEQPAVGTVSAQPKDVPTSHIKMVQLFFREEEHKHFVEVTDGLRDIYGKENLSETVLEALRRASVSAAIK